MHFAAVALLLMAGFAALTAVLIVFELLSRRSVEDATEHQVLHTLGMTSRQLIAAAVLRVSVTGVSAAAVAVAISFAASPLLPRGTPHVAEPHPGFTFNAAGFGMGAAGVVLVLTLLGVVAAARATASAGLRTPVRANQAGVPPLGRLLSLVRLPLVIATGARMALQPGRGRAAVPVRATLVATAIGLGAMAAALTFGASLGHLISTPALYGGTFDADVTPYGDAASMNQLVAAVRADPSVASVALGETGIPFQVGHVQFSGFARQNVEGSVSPTVIDGRLPDASDEVLLGSRTLEDLHAHIGQTVPVTVPGVTIRPVPLRVVGRAVFAPIAGSAGLGRGAMVTIEALAAFARVAPPGFQPPPPGDVFVRFRPRTSNPRAVAELGQRVANEQGFVNVPSQPTDLANFGQVRDLPQLLAGLLGVVSLATIAYMLITAVRRRRHDLAVLKSLGFAPRQVSAAVACQAISIVLVGAIIGVPLGTAAGRAAWAAVATQLGVVVRPTVPLLLVLGLVPTAVLLANLVAVGPAVIAGRTRAAATLHSE